MEASEMTRYLPQVCEALRVADPDIMAIAQFGSSVYMPDMASDEERQSAAASRPTVRETHLLKRGAA